MIVGNQWVPGLTQEQQFFHRAMSLLVSARRLSPQARLVLESAVKGEALVLQGGAVFTLRRAGQAVELWDDAFQRVGRWLV